MSKHIGNSRSDRGSTSVGGDNAGTIISGGVTGDLNIGTAVEPPKPNLRIAWQVNSPKQTVAGLIGLTGAFASIASIFGLTFSAETATMDLFGDMKPIGELLFAVGLRLLFVLPAGTAWLGLGAWHLARTQRMNSSKRAAGFIDARGDRRAAWFKAVGDCPVPRCGGTLTCYGKVVERTSAQSAWTGNAIERPSKWRYTAECSRSEDHNYPVDITDIQDLLAKRSRRTESRSTNAL